MRFQSELVWQFCAQILYQRGQMIPLATFLSEGLLDADRLSLYRMTVADVELGDWSPAL
jgi:hypothetical protein